MSKLKESLLLEGIMPLAERVIGTCSMKWLRQIGLMHTWSRDEIISWQNEHIQSFVQHAYKHTKFYHAIFDDLGISPYEINCAEDLRKLPIIDKETINKHYEEFIPDNLADFRYRSNRTGGTTGVPMEYYCDEETWGYVTAVKIYYWKKSGYKYGDAFVALGSSSLFGTQPSTVRRVYDKIRNEHGLNSVRLTDEICEQYAEYIQKHRIRYVYGYATSIYILSRYLQKTGRMLPLVNAIFTTAENLPDHYRSVIESVFKCKVMDCYGARDGGFTAYETQYHHYEVCYNAIAETVFERADGSGTLVSTNLLNYSFPLIRYNFGDEVVLQKDCDTEYNGQVITKINGRTSDIIRLDNGSELSSTGVSMIMKEFDIEAFEIHKLNGNQVELDIQPIAEKYSNEQELKIRSTIEGYMGAGSKLSIRYVDQFEALPNGKRKYFYV